MKVIISPSTVQEPRFEDIPPGSFFEYRIENTRMLGFKGHHHWCNFVGHDLSSASVRIAHKAFNNSEGSPRVVTRVFTEMELR